MALVPRKLARRFRSRSIFTHPGRRSAWPLITTIPNARRMSNRSKLSWSVLSIACQARRCKESHFLQLKSIWKRTSMTSHALRKPEKQGRLISRFRPLSQSSASWNSCILNYATWSRYSPTQRITNSSVCNTPSNASSSTRASSSSAWETALNSLSRFNPNSSQCP